MRGIPESECSLIDKIIDDFKGTNKLWIGIILLLFMLSNFSRTIRWQLLLKPLGAKARFSNAFFTIMLGYFANLGLPRIGEVVRAGMLARYEGIQTEKVLGTVVVDRAIDVLSLLLIILLAFILQFNVLFNYFRENIADSPFLTGNFMTIAIISILLLVAVWIFRRRIMRWRVLLRFREYIIGFAEGLRSIRSIDRPLTFIFHSVSIWVLYFLMTYFCFFAFEPTAHLNILAGLIVFVFGGLGIVFPSPGGMGTYHAMTIAALAIYHIPGEDAFSFANILFFSIQILCNVSFGLLALILLPILNRTKQPA